MLCPMPIYLNPRNWREGGPDWRSVALIALVLVLHAVLPRDLGWITLTVLLVGAASIVVRDIRKIS